MTEWPFAHNWDDSYVVTYSFKTEVLVSRSGREQRRAIRYTPRRTVQTAVLETGDRGRALDDWLWSQGANPFSFVDPIDGRVSTVRLPAQVSLDRPSESVTGATLVLVVEPGGDAGAMFTEDGFALAAEDGQTIIV